MMRIFMQTYTADNAQRNAELSECLAANRALEGVEVVTVERHERITFAEWFKIINTHVVDGDISILCNSDIKFDSSIRLCEFIQDDECFCLTRWEGAKMHDTGADAWVFRGKIRDVHDADFGLGIADCDYGIADRLKRAGYKLANPSPDIKANHVHASQHRTYYNLRKIFPPHIRHVPQLKLEERRPVFKVYTCYSKSHENMLKNYLIPSMPNGVELIAKEVEQHCPTGVYKSEGWMPQIKEKLILMQEMQADNELFVWLDVDVKIRSPFAFNIMLEELGDCDIAFQKDQNTACAGVFIGRRNERTRKLFADALDVLHQYGCDQPAINASFKTSGVKWKYLSAKFWNYSFFFPGEYDGRLKFQIPSDAVLVHANWCKGEKLKTAILEMA